MKLEQVYKSLIWDMSDLKQCLTKVWLAVQLCINDEVIDECRKRLLCCVAANGRHFNILYDVFQSNYLFLSFCPPPTLSAMYYVFRLSRSFDCSFVHLFRHILLPWYLMNGWNSYNKTDTEYSLALDIILLVRLTLAKAYKSMLGVEVCFLVTYILL